MEIRRAPSGRNVYWFESVGENRVLHLGCFAESRARSLAVYAKFLTQLHLANPSSWAEFQSNRRWWFSERRRDRKLLWKVPTYEDETYIACELLGNADIATALERFWLLKDIRFYYWQQGEKILKPEDLVPLLARKDFGHLTRFVPSLVRFVAAREICRSYFRVLFHQRDTQLIDEALATSAAGSGLEFTMEAEKFHAARAGVKDKL